MVCQLEHFHFFGLLVHAGVVFWWTTRSGRAPVIVVVASMVVQNISLLPTVDRVHIDGPSDLFPAERALFFQSSRWVG